MPIPSDIPLSIFRPESCEDPDFVEEKILEGCRQGKRTYQDALVRRFAPYLITVCRRYAQDPYLAEDALQETFIRAFKYIKTYEGRGDLRAWLRKVAVNTTLQMIRKPVYRDFGDIEQACPVREVPEVFSRMAVEEIFELIDRLPEGYRIVFNLYAIDGYSHREIAEWLDISESTSRSQLARARKMLVELLKKNK